MTMSLKHYVVGFMTSGGWDPLVLLIRKARPPWQAGRLNGPGGSLEPGEAPIDAMVREFFEETGLKTTASDWRRFAVLQCPQLDDRLFGEHEVHVHFFMSHSGLSESMVFPDVDGETPQVHKISDLENLPVIPNLRWLIPMGLSEYRGERARSFTITEVDQRPQ